MKILYIITVGKVVGGAEKNTFMVKDILGHSGHEVKVLSSNLYEDEGLESDYTFKAISSSTRLRHLQLIFNWDAFFKLRKILKEWNPDIVHLNTLGHISPLALLLLKRRKTVTHLHGPDEFIPGLVLWYMPSKWFINDSRSLDTLTLMGKFVYVGHRYLYMPLYIAILKGTVYLAPSKYMQSVAEKDLYPVLHLPNGIESKKFYTYKSGGPILFVGRLEKVKGIDYLIDAMVIVHKLCPNAKLVVIGSGAHEFEAHEKIRAYHLEDCIKFVGWIARKKIDDYYKKCSMLVIPSVWPEISGNVITEAMYIGRPVVATRVGGIPEIVKNNHNGLLVPAKNSESLAEAIMKVFIDKEMAEKMGRNAHEDVKKLNFDIHTKKLLEIYKKIIAGEY